MNFHLIFRTWGSFKNSFFKIMVFGQKKSANLRSYSLSLCCSINSIKWVSTLAVSPQITLPFAR
jgi:hypothetical protein